MLKDLHPLHLSIVFISIGLGFVIGRVYDIPSAFKSISGQLKEIKELLIKLDNKK